MFDWFVRQQKRQRELEQGADADLVRANGRRATLSFCLYGAAVLIFAVTKSLSDPWHRTFTVAATVCLVFGFFLGLWARVERTFLNQPEPKEPPRLWK